MWLVGNFVEFENVMLCNVVVGIGMFVQQILQNWLDVNYSLYWVVVFEVWKMFDCCCCDFGCGFGQLIFCVFVEEVMEVDSLLLLVGVFEFNMVCVVYMWVWWIGLGCGYVDLLKEWQGVVLGIEFGFLMFEDELVEVFGIDWCDNVD